MYHMNDKQNAVREVQRFLLGISEGVDYLPHVTVDGFYDDATRLAISSFQRENNLPITGRTDKDTFDLLYAEYVRINDNADKALVILDIDAFPLKRGSSGSDVATLNTGIRELAVYYKELSSPNSDYFSYDTEEAVKLLQEYFLMDITGVVDINMFDRINNEVFVRKKFKAPK